MKSDRERQKSHDMAYMWNQMIWYKRTYLQNRNRVTYKKQIYGYWGGGQGGINWTIGTDIYTQLYVK